MGKLDKNEVEKLKLKELEKDIEQTINDSMDILGGNSPSSALFKKSGAHEVFKRKSVFNPGATDTLGDEEKNEKEPKKSGFKNADKGKLLDINNDINKLIG